MIFNIRSGSALKLKVNFARLLGEMKSFPHFFSVVVNDINYLLQLPCRYCYDDGDGNYVRFENDDIRVIVITSQLLLPL